MSIVSIREPGERRTYMEEILILQMGGTIDKSYPRTRNGYAFEIDTPASRRVLARLRPGKSTLVVHDTICRKDSMEVMEKDRNRLLERVTTAPQRRVLVTHGTDTLLQTALWLQEQLQACLGSNSRIVVFTGAFTPEVFKDSDADFNIGLALGALQSLPATGNSRVYVAMNGLVCPCESMDRDPETGQFLPCRRPRSRDMTLPRSRSGEHQRQRSLESLLDGHSTVSQRRRSGSSSRESLLDRASDGVPEPLPEQDPAPSPTADPGRAPDASPRLPARSTPPNPARRQASSGAALSLSRLAPAARSPPGSPLRAAARSPTSPAAVELDADAVFSASVQYLQAQRARSCPQMSLPVPSPRPSARRREPETTADPSLAPARRSAVRTNGSLRAPPGGGAANSSFGLRRSAALLSLPAGEAAAEVDGEADGEAEADGEGAESPLAMQKKAGLRRTLPPGWRHLPQRALEDLVEEEEGDRAPQARMAGFRSLLRRLSEGGHLVTEDIAEEQL